MSDIVTALVTETPTQSGEPSTQANTTQEVTTQTSESTQDGRKSYGDWRDQIPKTLWDKVDRDQLPPKLGEYLETNLSLNTAKGELDAIKSKAIIPPEEGADDAAWNNYWNKLGRPEKADGYELKRGEGDGKSDQLDASMKSLFHKIGLTKQQGEVFFQESLKLGKDTLSKIQEIKAQQSKQAEEALRRDWGRDYDAKKTQVMKGVEKVFGPETMAKVVESGLGNDPNFMKGLLSVSKAFSEDGFIDGPRSADTGRPGVNQYDWQKK